MRNGFLHDAVLLDPIEFLLRQRGARVHREFRVSLSRSVGFIDLFAVLEGHTLACEAELTPRRVPADLAKARAAAASHLLIVTPTGRIAKAIKAGLLGPNEALAIVVLPQGPAALWVEDCFPLFSRSIAPAITNQKGRS